VEVRAWRAEWAFLLSPKPDLEIVSMDEGRQIDVSDENRSNAGSPGIDNLDTDSNVTVERLSQPLKDFLAIVSTDDDRQSFRSDLAKDRFRWMTLSTRRAFVNHREALI
jgi:hypothetical protein